MTPGGIVAEARGTHTGWHLCIAELDHRPSFTCRASDALRSPLRRFLSIRHRLAIASIRIFGVISRARDDSGWDGPRADTTRPAAEKLDLSHCRPPVSCLFFVRDFESDARLRGRQAQALLHERGRILSIIEFPECVLESQLFGASHTRAILRIKEKFLCFGQRNLAICCEHLCHFEKLPFILDAI